MNDPCRNWNPQANHHVAGVTIGRQIQVPQSRRLFLLSVRFHDILEQTSSPFSRVLFLWKVSRRRRDRKMRGHTSGLRHVRSIILTLFVNFSEFQLFISVPHPKVVQCSTAHARVRFVA